MRLNWFGGIPSRSHGGGPVGGGGRGRGLGSSALGHLESRSGLAEDVRGRGVGPGGGSCERRRTGTHTEGRKEECRTQISKRSKGKRRKHSRGPPPRTRGRLAAPSRRWASGGGSPRDARKPGTTRARWSGDRMRGKEHPL